MLSSPSRKRTKPKKKDDRSSHTPPKLPQLRMLEEPCPNLFPSKEELLRLLVVIAIATSVAVACNYIFASLRRKPKPFCDSIEDDPLHYSPPDFCEPCPEHGQCEKGELECVHGYKKIGRRCIEDGEVNRAANKFSNWIKDNLCKACAHFLCEGTGRAWFQEEELLQMLEERRLMENIGLKDGAFTLIKQMAMENTGSSLETRTTLNGIKEFKCPNVLAETYKPFSCSLRQWIYEHFLVVLCVSVALVGVVMLSFRVRRKQCLSSRAEDLYEQICEILEENVMAAKSSSNKSEPWVVSSWLRDHLLLPRERKDAMLWKKVEELVQEDSRIDQYPKLIKGESRIVLEWQVEGALSSKMRTKGAASKTKVNNHDVKDSTNQGRKLLFGEMN